MQPAQAGASNAVTVNLFNPAKSKTTFKLALRVIPESATVGIRRVVEELKRR